MAEAFLPNCGQSLYLENYTVRINLQLTILIFLQCLSYYHGEERQTQALQWERAVFNRTEKNCMPPATYFLSTCLVGGECPSGFCFFYPWAQKSAWAATGLHKCAKEEPLGLASQHAQSFADKLVSGPELNEVFRENFSANQGISKVWTCSKTSVIQFIYFYLSFERLKVQLCGKL